VNRRPNVVYVYADQLRYDAVGFDGNRVVRTPTFDRLAREGVVLDEAIASAPICAPYRGQLLTGRYAHANGVIDNEYALFDDQPTLPRVLREHGYRTAYVGKWHLGYPPFDESARQGFDDLYGYNNAHEYYRVEYWHNERGPFPMVDFAPAVETQLAIDYLSDHAAHRPDDPFCLVLSWGPPHWGWMLEGRRDYGEYPQEFNVHQPADVPLRPNVPPQFDAFARREIADYYGMTAALDACMARLLDALSTLGLADDTIVVFTSDHGDHLSSHGYGKPFDAWMHHTLRASKATPFEESVHVPFVLRYPARVRGNRRDGVPFSTVDVMPTLLGFCGVPVPETVQGRDLSPVFLGEALPDKPDSVFLQIMGPGWPDREKWVGLWRGVRTPRYTYARWKDRGGMRLLFDRERDPYEMTNLIDDPGQAAVAEALEGRLQRWLTETGDPFDTGERLPVTEMLDVGQRFTTPRWYDLAPRAYAEALRRRR
jgi:arylsulfatase A-like enzyme